MCMESWVSGGGDNIGETFASPSNLSTLSLGNERTALQVATGQYHTCVLLDDKSIKCWGDNLVGQLGYGDSTERHAPEATATVNLGASKTAKQVVAGAEFTCAILNDDTVKCWGQNGVGALGNGNYNSTNEPHATNTGQPWTGGEVFGSGLESYLRYSQ